MKHPLVALSLTIFLAMTAAQNVMADVKPVVIGVNSREPDAVDKLLDNMGGKRWTPGEPPERLTEIINEGAAQTHSSTTRQDIRSCLSIGDVNTKFMDNSLRIAADVTNMCDTMISYFSKYQLVGRDRFPLAQEVQNSYTQIAGHEHKTELGVFSEKIETAPSDVIIQITSFDQQAYGTVSKQNALNVIFPDGYFKSASKKTGHDDTPTQCITVNSIKAKLLQSNPIPTGASPNPNFIDNEGATVSVIIRLQNTCNEAKGRNGLMEDQNPNQPQTTYYFADRDGFAASNEQALTSAYVIEGKEMVQKAIISVPTEVYKHKKTYIITFNIHSGNSPTLQTSIPLSDVEGNK